MLRLTYFGFRLQPEVQARALHRYPRQDLRGLIPRAPKEAIDLLEGLLEFEPSQRLTAHEALRHPYFLSNTASPGLSSNGAASAQQQQQATMLHQQAIARQQQEQVSKTNCEGGGAVCLASSVGSLAGLPSRPGDSCSDATADGAAAAVSATATGDVPAV